VILPLVAIATPATYVKEPLRVFELDFEANLPIIRQAVKYKKRVIFPSTSEVYGMSQDPEFDPENSNWSRPDQQAALDLLLRQADDGPRDPRLRPAGRPRIHAVPPLQLDRPGLDSIHTPKEGSSRVITQFLGHIVRGEPIKLVDGGARSAPSPMFPTASTR
jgi:hypothetical protein